MAKRWSEISHKGMRIHRKHYVRLLVTSLRYGDWGTVPFLIRRSLSGRRLPKKK